MIFEENGLPRATRGAKTYSHLINREDNKGVSMKWTNGLPSDNGSTDLEDSARLAGLMVLFDHPESKAVDMTRYFDGIKYVRHDQGETKYACSRDQGVVIMAALWKQGYYDKVSLKYIDGKDIMSPSIRGHEARCQNKSASWLQNLWLRFDIMYHAKFEPVGKETNQLLCLLLVAGNPYLKMYCEWHNDWRESITTYWCGWRREPFLAEHMIKAIENKIKE